MRGTRAARWPRLVAPRLAPLYYPLRLRDGGLWLLLNDTVTCLRLWLLLSRPLTRCLTAVYIGGVVFSFVLAFVAPPVPTAYAVPYGCLYRRFCVFIRACMKNG